MKLGLAPVKLTGAKPSPICGPRFGLAPARFLVVFGGATRMTGVEPSHIAGLELGLAPARILVVCGATQLAGGRAWGQDIIPAWIDPPIANSFGGESNAASNPG